MNLKSAVVFISVFQHDKEKTPKKTTALLCILAEIFR
ncbi:hypothetical protein CF65_00083 [Aggregatibacter actinomycetemcomitans HK1651]|nr:hypothetical protein CF65_00083 [Aggregatibacter actinomycetemcomitans HK1651]